MTPAPSRHDGEDVLRETRDVLRDLLREIKAFGHDDPNGVASCPLCKAVGRAKSVLPLAKMLRGYATIETHDPDDPRTYRYDAAQDAWLRAPREEKP